MTNYITSLNTNISVMFCRKRGSNSTARPSVRLPNECRVHWIWDGVPVFVRLFLISVMMSRTTFLTSSFIPRINFQKSLRVPSFLTYCQLWTWIMGVMVIVLGLTSVASRDAEWQDTNHAIDIDVKVHFKYMISDPCQVCSNKRLALAGQAEAELVGVCQVVC
jgi:hypothetical protein